MKISKISTLLLVVIGFTIASCELSVDERISNYERYECQIGGQWYTCAR